MNRTCRVPQSLRRQVRTNRLPANFGDFAGESRAGNLVPRRCRRELAGNIHQPPSYVQYFRKYVCIFSWLAEDDS